VKLVLLAVLAVALAAPAAGGQSQGAPFFGTVTLISGPQAKRMTGVSWRPGCPVALRDLRLVTVKYWGFDGRVHTGRLILHEDVWRPVLRALHDLYETRFRIRRMVPIDAFGGSDFRSIEADNTSAFNCRYVDGTTRWSEHAYGRAIDVNPIENPYVSGGTTSHGASRPYLDRSRRRPGMAYEGGALVRAFDAAGWGWGGRWSGAKDYQHFSASGR
jgi:D-alanyl-D-alanine carboxypeptidase